MAKKKKEKIDTSKKFLLVCIIFLMLSIPFLLRKKVYYCDGSDSLLENGKKCESVTFFDASTRYYCYDNDILNGTTCNKPGTYSFPATKTYTCPYGYYASGNNCYVNGTFTTANSKCPIWYSWDSRGCYAPVSGHYEYKCYIGKLQGTSCIDSYSYPYAAPLEYYCTLGVLVGHSCAITETYAAHIKYTSIFS